MPHVERIPLSSIVVDAQRVQTRARGTVQAVVERYADAKRAGSIFPPPDVFFDGTTYVLADGFHRVAADAANGAESVEVTVHAGGLREAILFSVRANTEHGLPRSRVDKRRAVEMLLRDADWSKRSDSWICAAAGITHRVLAEVRKYMGVPRAEHAVGRDGRTSVRGGRGKGAHYTGDAWHLAPTSLPALLTYLAAHPRATLVDACNTFDVAPKSIMAAADRAAKEGHHVSFAASRDERAEYQLKLRMRELGDAKARLLEELRQKDVQLETMMSLQQAPIEPIVARRGIGEGKRRQGVPVMVMSDLHVEERVTLEKTLGLNEYNLEIAEQCIDRCAEAFEWFAQEKKSHWDMRTAVLAIIGDTFSGWIHAELIESNFLSPIKAVMWLEERLERMIRTILATTDFEQIIVILKDGNHGRLTQKIRASTRTENSLEWLMFHHLAARFVGESRLRFQIDDAIYSYVDIFGKTLAATHGDQWQYMGGVGGLLIPVRRGVNEARKLRHFDTVMMGHFHTYMPLDDIHVNGSMIGVSAYSISKSFTPERRRQSWFLLDSHNWKTENAPVWLVREPEPAWREYKFDDEPAPEGT